MSSKHPPAFDDRMPEAGYSVLRKELEVRLTRDGACKGNDHTLAILAQLPADGLIADETAALAWLEEGGALCDCDVIGHGV